ncbi:uncharacterized protein EV420DRAFT_1657553 [Desarmillaria tabescens]|uniref:Uncharacterized protein n=1 Tax=Armillaria tabescens TaxID=1929756 RepID=A0AA39ME44_ARMTA|nr:uncharacterized protein EV420DRAFT_1657553 [Desarmillaria tabescens]KAK0430473.1 hypothetical protein EV420DRAFT_1657553 [Desarmillaria tabescens]
MTLRRVASLSGDEASSLQDWEHEYEIDVGVDWDFWIFTSSFTARKEPPMDVVDPPPCPPGSPFPREFRTTPPALHPTSKSATTFLLNSQYHSPRLCPLLAATADSLTFPSFTHHDFCSASGTAVTMSKPFGGAAAAPQTVDKPIVVAVSPPSPPVTSSLPLTATATSLELQVLVVVDVVLMPPTTFSRYYSLPRFSRRLRPFSGLKRSDDEWNSSITTKGHYGDRGYGSPLRRLKPAHLPHPPFYTDDDFLPAFKCHGNSIFEEPIFQKSYEDRINGLRHRCCPAAAATSQHSLLCGLLHP